MDLVANHLVEIEAQLLVGGDSGEEESKAGQCSKDWVASELFYGMEAEKAEGKSRKEEEGGAEDESGEKGKKHEKSMYLEGNLEQHHIGEKGMNWFEQMVPAIDTFGGASGEQHSMQRKERNRWSPTGICRDYMGTYDVLKEVLGSD